MAETMLDKIWRNHQIKENLIYIDLHLVHEVTSPQAFESLRLAGRQVRRPDRTLATADHNVPTDNSLPMISDPLSRRQLHTLQENCSQFSIPYYGLGSRRQGIVHVIGPELGLTQPGMTIVCGDSHTATHGAFGALAFGIGTSEVEHVLATQTLTQHKPASMRILFTGSKPHTATAKDMILYAIGQIGVSGAQGYAVEYAGEAIKALSMEGRMTICNMTIEAGGRAGMIAPDQKTLAWIEGRPAAPEDMDRAADEWLSLPSDPQAEFDCQVEVDISNLPPMVSWGTTPAQVVPVDGVVPEPQTDSEQRALTYMNLTPGQSMTELRPDKVFIGSCTNSRIGDLRAAAEIVKGKKVSSSLQALVVPGSASVKAQAEKEGLDEVFINAGFEWRSAGCSMCLGMNPDQASPGERVFSSSNRNFEGRQGKGARSHLMSPQMAAAAAVAGRLVDIRKQS